LQRASFLIAVRGSDLNSTPGHCQRSYRRKRKLPVTTLLYSLGLNDERNSRPLLRTVTFARGADGRSHSIRAMALPSRC
jgi:hypothetical protein